MIAVAILVAQVPRRFEFNQIHMGVEVRVTLFAADEDTAQRAARAAFERFAELDDKLSDYQKNSELNRMLALAAKAPVVVSNDMFRVLEKGQQIAVLTGGAFDMTVRPLVALWRKSRKSLALPTTAELTAAKALVGHKNLKLDTKLRTIKILKDGVLVDFGGIAKGFACDEALITLKHKGILSAMVEAGGDLACSESPPQEKGWKVLIYGTEREVLLRNQAMSTSGSTEQFVLIGGKRYSHIIDPKTGRGLTNLRQVTVIGPKGLETDPLATAACIDPGVTKNFPRLKFIVRDEKVRK